MAQYQTFPEAPGDSQTLEKLKALRLPSLFGRSFLDVGCNEGFFCGYARFDGAARVVGLDDSALFIRRARERFPDCEFVHQGWGSLPDGPFDVVLLASSLHYADDQPALIQRMVDALSPDGVLVLELGVARGTANEWVKVQRGPDERYFPTRAALEEVFEPYAWKYIAPSVRQSGDPVSRHVFHVRRRKPVAYLLMERPDHGKSSICRTLFGQAGVRVVSGDQTMDAIAKDRLAAPPELTEAIRLDFSPATVAKTMEEVLASGLAASLVKVWVEQAEGEDFAVDAYVPVEHRAEIARLVADEGFMTVVLTWQRVGIAPSLPEEAAEHAERFFSYLALRGNGANGGAGTELPFEGMAGCVDEMTIENEELTIRGWALDDAGKLPSLFRVSLGDRTIDVERIEEHVRRDVQKSHGLPHAMCGYTITLPVPGLAELPGTVEVFAGSSSDQLHGPLRFSSSE